MSLDELHRGFRSPYLSYDELTTQVKAWAEAFPDVVRLSSLGTTPEGREQWLLTLGPEPDRSAPAGVGRRQHPRLGGRRLERRPGHRRGRDPAPRRGQGPRAAARARRHPARRPVLRPAPDDPRRRRAGPVGSRATSARCPATIAPTGARRGGSSATSTVTAWPWRCGCKDAGGDYVESPERPGPHGPARASPTRARSIASTPRARSSTSTATPSRRRSFLCDNPIDLNRNFPYGWAPHHDQPGAGPFPTSEPEARNVVAFATAPPRDLRLDQPPHLRRRPHPPARPRARQQDGPERPRGVPPGRGLDGGARRLPDGVGLRGVPLRARQAAPRRRHRLRLPPARRDRRTRSSCGTCSRASA